MKPDPPPPVPALFSLPEQKSMLRLARQSIHHGVHNHAALQYQDGSDLPVLDDFLACFVTLHIKCRLRGCVGTLTPHRSLGEDICQNAYNAAFRDPRFPAVTLGEVPRLHLAISVLSETRAFPVDSEQELLDGLYPGVDGLVLIEGSQRALFLPTVWDQLREPARFVEHLKRKAGLSRDHWSETIRFEKFHTFEFRESDV